MRKKDNLKYRNLCKKYLKMINPLNIEEVFFYFSYINFYLYMQKKKKIYK
jgi:hypothetical protein